jgi:hypothetical protein
MGNLEYTIHYASRIAYELSSKISEFDGEATPVICIMSPHWQAVVSLADAKWTQLANLGAPRCSNGCCC